MAPTKIGRYEVRGELGRGGMATVYRAYDPSFEREVAIKMIPRELLHDPQFKERFKREIKTIAALEHPAIVPVYDVGEEDGVPYFVMRYMSGGSLTQWINRGKFSLEDAARIIERVSSALAYAHKNGLVHRDLKPDNILFDNNGDPFISDFGVAKLLDSSTNMTGSGIIGTPAYMSPEQAQGEKVDNRSDIYGLGVIIFQMLSGQQPYNATTPMGIAVKHITEPVPEILRIDPTLPASTDKIIKTAMAKNRDERYPSATELARALNEAAAKEKAAEMSAAKPASGGSKLALVIGGAAVLVVIVAAAVFFLLRGQPAAPVPAPTSVPPTAIPPTSTSLPTQAPVPTTAVTEAALAPLPPACAAGLVQAVPTPSITEKQRLCANKVAYTVLIIPQDATYTALKPGYKCEDIPSQAAGQRWIQCSGPDLTFFDLKVCNPQPTAVATVAGAECGAGSVYDSANQCCAPAPAADAGCTSFQVNLKSCTQ